MFRLKKKKKTTTTQNPTPTLDPNDPFNDDERERQEVEALAKKFENKYVSILSPCLMARGCHSKPPHLPSFSHPTPISNECSSEVQFHNMVTEKHKP